MRESDRADSRGCHDKVEFLDPFDTHKKLRFFGRGKQYTSRCGAERLEIT
jgi:hypothetical protein